MVLNITPIEHVHAKKPCVAICSRSMFKMTRLDSVTKQCTVRQNSIEFTIALCSVLSHCRVQRFVALYVALCSVLSHCAAFCRTVALCSVLTH